MSERMMPSNRIFQPVPSRFGTAFAFAPAFPLAPALAGLLAAGIFSGAHAQVTQPTAAPAQDTSAAAVAAPKATGRRALFIEPRVSVTETMTDNALLNNTDKRADSITQ
ncbi:MAG TPA: hypothetical protein VLJ57_01800, partial [Burkholderiaceae bacterium]|nr:hypothetical protein [Burkholderiaceae bacterium]